MATKKSTPKKVAKKVGENSPKLTPELLDEIIGPSMKKAWAFIENAPTKAHRKAAIKTFEGLILNLYDDRLSAIQEYFNPKAKAKPIKFDTDY